MHIGVLLDTNSFWNPWALRPSSSLRERQRRSLRLAALLVLFPKEGRKQAVELDRRPWSGAEGKRNGRIAGSGREARSPGRVSGASAVSLRAKPRNGVRAEIPAQGGPDTSRVR